MPRSPALAYARPHIFPRRPQYYDDFRRADNASSLGTSPSGQVWTPGVGTWGTLNGGARLVTSAGQDVAVIATQLANCLVGVTYSVVGANSHRLIFRYTDTSNYWLMQTEGTVYKIYKYVAGGFTQMGTFTYTPTNGDQLAVWMTGSQIEAYLNGYPVMSISDAHNSTATSHGLGGAVNTNSPGTSQWRDFFVSVP